MTLDVSAVGYTSQPYTFKYDWKAVSLYALGIGAKREELDYIFEGRGPKVYPTFAVIPPLVALGELLGKTGGNPAMVVHGGQLIRMLAPIPSEGTMTTVGTVKGVYDLKKMGQILVATTTEIGGKPVFETEWSIIVRGAGGFGGEPPPKVSHPEIPEGQAPTWVEEESTTPEQALLYRLSGDLNPLHADPSFATMVGFPQGPILHGLCTYGFVGRAIAKHAAGGDALKLKAFQAQFRKPVWPGEKITTKGWDLGDGRVAVQAYAEDRPEPVITNAWAELG